MITVQELEIGVLLAERRDTSQGAHLRDWLNRQVLPAFSGRLIPVDAVVTQCSARLHVANPRPFRDSLIAATVLVHQMIVVTRKVTDFESLGVRLLNLGNIQAELATRAS